MCPMPCVSTGSWPSANSPRNRRARDDPSSATTCVAPSATTSRTDFASARQVDLRFTAAKMSSIEGSQTVGTGGASYVDDLCLGAQMAMALGARGGSDVALGWRGCVHDHHGAGGEARGCERR